jgi:hypothetical protein
MAAHRLAAFFSKSLVAAKLDARAAFGFGAGNAGTFQIVDAVLNMRTKFILDLALNPGTMKKSGGKGAKVS